MTRLRVLSALGLELRGCALVTRLIFTRPFWDQVSSPRDHSLISGAPCSSESAFINHLRDPCRAAGPWVGRGGQGLRHPSQLLTHTLTTTNTHTCRQRPLLQPPGVFWFASVIRIFKISYGYLSTQRWLLTRWEG